MLWDAGRTQIDCSKIWWKGRQAQGHECDRNGFLHRMHKEISLSLIGGNARIFSYYMGLLLRGTGVDFQEGATAPTPD